MSGSISTPAGSSIAHAAKPNRTAARTVVTRYPRFKAPIGASSSPARTTYTPTIEANTPNPRATSGNRTPRTPNHGNSATPRTIAPMFSAAGDSKRSAPRTAGEGKPDDGKTGYRAASKRYHEGVVERPHRTRSGADVRANRDLHPDVAGQCRERRAECERASGLQAQHKGVRFPTRHPLPKDRHGEDDGKDRSDDCDRLVLPAQEGAGSLLNRRRNLPHPLGARVLSEDAPRQDSREAERREDRDWDDEGQIKLRDGVPSSAVSAAASCSTYLGFDGSLRRRTSRRGSRHSRGRSSRPSREVAPGHRVPCSARRS